VTALLIDRLRRDLAEAGFGVSELDELWGPVAAAALERGHRVPALRALAHRDASPLATLARMFVFGIPVTTEAAAVAFPRLGLDGAVALGLVGRDGDDAIALSDMRPYSFTDDVGAATWWIASDRGEMATGAPLAEDHVLGVGGASLTLSRFMVQEPVGSVLDLGTGCGIQAMHASRHAERVVATDISERALHYATFNAALNGIDSIEFRHGDLFDPVADELFERIVSNPPFVITPRGAGVPAYDYRDGGMAGDDLVAVVVRGAAEHLAPGGIAQMLGNWETRGDRDGIERAAEWTRSLGVDAWIVERERQDDAEYSETWIRDGGIRAGTPEFDTLSAAWLEDFASRDVSGVGFGYITLRKPLSGTPTLARFESCPGPAGDDSLAAHISAALATHDRLARLDDAGLLSERLSVAGDVTDERHYWPGDDDPTVMLLRQGGGLARVIAADTALAAFVGACDGDLSVGAICSALGELLGVDDASLTAELVVAVRELLFTGVLQFS